MKDINDKDSDNDDSIIDVIAIYSISDEGAPAVKSTF